ncbi:hypothetical protein KR074_003574 [Drosophila pseudoananassae]|nr:hypothetical protein KR074_003574 [Drosophila pseudoananassae]
MYSIATRSRTRRMSLLDTDSRPGTPQLDSAAERGTASPRPTRRTRLNSATMDTRTPTRATRSSVARGETPEPSTPSSVKRTARTPAKATRSVMKQLPLKEETAEEMDAKQEEPVERTGTPVGDRRVTRSMSQTPPSVNRSPSASPPSQPDSKVSSEEKQTAVSGEQKEEQDKKKIETKEKINNAQFTNKFSVRLEKTPLKRASESTPRKDSSESAKKTKSSDVEIVENIFPVEKIKALNESSSTAKKSDSPAVEIVDEDFPVEKIKALNESSPNLPKVSKKPDHKDTDPEESLKKTDDREPEEQPHKLDEKTLSPELQTPTGEKSEELTGSPSAKKLESNGLATSAPLEAKTPIKKEHSEELPKKTTPQKEHSETLPEQLKTEEEVPPAKSQKNVSSEELFLDAEDVPEELELKSNPNKEKEVETDLTAKQPSESVAAKEVTCVESPEPMDVDEAIDDEVEGVDLVEETVDGSPKLEQKKSVGFKGGDVDSPDEKTRFPKTPGRDKATINRTNILVPDTPIRTPKPAALSKGRSSSTPIAKDQLPSKAPSEIDVIKPFSQLESEKKEQLHDTSSTKTAKSPKILKLFSDEDGEDNDSENECEFVEDQAEEAPGNYQSGDSMDSSIRREMEENEIPSHGESVGSQDTEEGSNGEEEEQENDSFVVSDDDEEEDLSALCFSNDEEDESEVEAGKKRESKGGKKRSRIVVPDSSEDSIEMTETKHDKSNCLNASRLSDAAQKMNNSSKNSTTETSETELENSRRKLLNELNKSERLNKTVPRLDVTEIEDNFSTDSDEKPVSKKASLKGIASVYEVLDSDEFEAPEEVKEPSHKELETSKGNKSIYEVEESDESQEPEGGDDKSSKKTSGKSSDEEAALLDTLASSDLRHLATMFNPLQKSRRQSLYTASPEVNAKEPKLKRRSDRGLGSDNFCPSTSFVEMVAERQRLKRKHLSKSFSGAPEDLEEVELQHDRKRLKNSPLKFAEAEKNAEVAAETEKAASDLKRASTSSEEFVDDNSELSEGEIPRKSLKKDDFKNVSLRKHAVKESSPEIIPKEEKESGQPLKEDPEVADEQPSTSREALKPKAKQPESLFKTKTVDYYMEYCDKIFQAANEAAMNQKKQRASMSGTKPGNEDPEAETVASEKPLSEELPKTSHKTASIPTKKEAKPTTIAKKDVKRLQATRQAVGHAVNLLTGSAATKEPRSLANKLGAKSQMDAKKPGKKQKQAKLNSSDEENHNRKVTRFRNNAGYVTVLEGTPAKHSIELIRTKSGIMRVEPSTPKQKYFLEMPDTPRNLQGGFREEPSGSSGGHLKGKKPGRKQAPKPGEDKGNSAKQSALRFKERVFARKF